MVRCCGCHLEGKIREYAEKGAVTVTIIKNVSVVYGVGDTCVCCTCPGEFNVEAKVR